MLSRRRRALRRRGVPGHPGAPGRRAPGRRAVGAVAALTLVLAACTPDTPAPPEVDDTWPAPDPARPVVRLAYDVAEGHETVTGREDLTFRPDLEVCEVVLRAWPNKPATARADNAMVIEEVSVDGIPLEHGTEQAGAPEGAPGTLVEVTLPTCRPAGSEITVGVDFTLTLGEGTDERLGRDAENGIAWLGTAFPLLAWQRGVGWVRDEAVDLVGEATTSETFELAELRVTVPEDEQVAAVGERVGEPTAGTDGRTTHVFAAPAMRDVAVTVGRIEVHSSEAAEVEVHLAVPRGTPGTRVAQWQEMVATALEDLRELLGPVPYDDLWVSVLPAVTDGVELSGAVQLTPPQPDEDEWLVAHELAHQWFYGLVGNNQARDPWLDESLATYAQEVVQPEGWEVPRRAREGMLGAPMSEWVSLRRSSSAYVATVYTGGGALLAELREEAGAAAFDEALRGYLRENAHEVVGPEVLRESLSGLPGVDEALERAGAWDW